FHFSELPRDIQVSSQTRHNISMAGKEAINNVIKHAGASEGTIQIALARDSLEKSIRDDGSGLDAETNKARHGLTNMKRRLGDNGGKFKIKSHLGAGTLIHLQLELKDSKSVGSNTGK